MVIITPMTRLDSRLDSRLDFETVQYGLWLPFKEEQLLFIFFYIYRDLDTRRVPLSYTPCWHTRSSEVEIERSARELGTTVCVEQPGFVQDFPQKAKKKSRKRRSVFFLGGGGGGKDSF